MATAKNKRRTRIKLGIRSKIKGTAQRPRLAIYRSNKEIYAQVIDDVAGLTLAQASSAKLDSKGSKVEVSKAVGSAIAKAAQDKGVESVIFDRGGYLYHGRVQALAEGAREGGLKF